MKFPKILFLALSLSICFSQDVHSKYRIEELIPDLMAPLAVEPAIPEDFISVPTSKEAGSCQWIYWGKQEVIDQLFEDHKTVLEPLIRVRLTAYVAQTGPDSFSIDRDVIDFPHRIEKFKWGSYPVRAHRILIQNKVVYMAYVGLNAPGGLTLLFNLHLPESEQGSDLDKNYPLWENFLRNTKPFSEKELYKMNGLELEEGETIVEVAEEKLKVTAEEDKNGIIRVVFQPLTPHISYDDKESSQTYKAGEWKTATPMMRIPTEIEVVKDNNTIYDRVVVYVFVKKVDEFTIPTERLKAEPKVKVIELKSEFK